MQGAARRASKGLSLARRAISADRQLDREAAALADGAVHVDGAAEQFDVALGDGQAQAGVQAVRLPGRVGPEEALENVLARFRRDADAGVRDFQQ